MGISCGSVNEQECKQVGDGASVSRNVKIQHIKYIAARTVPVTYRLSTVKGYHGYNSTQVGVARYHPPSIILC
jgi:hypothetical protein